MITKKNLLTVLLFVFFSTCVANYALAQGDDSAGLRTPEQNQENLAAAIKHTEEALAAAQKGDAAATEEHSKAAYDSVIEINSESWAPKIQGAIGKLRIAGIKAKKGDTEKAAELLGIALAKLKKIN